jgi:hypothetical protein
MKYFLALFLLSPIKGYSLNSPTGTSSEVLLSYALIIGVCLFFLGISKGIKWLKEKLKSRTSSPHEMPQLPE